MSTPRFYSWDDDGSPGRALTGNLQNRLKQILVACLVNGYGSKPGAGWTLEHEHANGFTLSNGDAYVNFVSNLPASAPYPAMSPVDIHVYMSESLTDGSAAVIKGANLCSGTFRFDSGESSGYPRHMVAAKWALIDRLTTLQWTLIADDKTAVIYCSGEIRYEFSIYLGAPVSDLGVSDLAVALGGGNYPYEGHDNTLGFSALCKGFTAPRSPRNGLSEYVTLYCDRYERLSEITVAADITGVPPKHLHLQAPALRSGDSFVGRARGVAYDDVLMYYGWPLYLRALGFTGKNFSDRGRVVSINGHQYAFAAVYNGGFVMTDDPAFW